MDNLKIYKYFALLTLIINLIIAFFFILKINQIHNLAGENIDSSKIISLYIYLILIVLLVIYLFRISIKIRTYAKNADNKLQEKIRIEEKDNDKENNIEIEEDKTETKDKKYEKILDGLKEQKTHEKYTEKFLINLSAEFEIVQGLFYIYDTEEDLYKISSTYAYYGEEQPKDFKIGDGLSGQVVKSKKEIEITDIPEKYMTILSGLGKGAPKNLIILPVFCNKDIIGVIELASFVSLNIDLKEFVKFMENIGKELAKMIKKKK
ncbi:MAG: GAF domain-containing protein [Bacteroidales bacterium]|nr:GAF domain-containing protein [Bacteroidales bacterium]